MLIDNKNTNKLNVNYILNKDYETEMLHSMYIALKNLMMILFFIY